MAVVVEEVEVEVEEEEVVVVGCGVRRISPPEVEGGGRRVGGEEGEAGEVM